MTITMVTYSNKMQTVYISKVSKDHAKRDGVNNNCG